MEKRMIYIKIIIKNKLTTKNNVINIGYITVSFFKNNYF